MSSSKPNPKIVPAPDNPIVPAQLDLRMPAVTHPPVEELRAFALGNLTSKRAAEIEQHVESCDVCGRTLAAAPDDTLVALARDAAAQTLVVSPQISEPELGNQIPSELREHPRYRVLGLLGSGGMGAVYKAEHRMMERSVALKVISRKFLTSPAAVDRFLREVKTAAKLNHPNIVASFDAEQAGNLHFLVMEYVDGISLDRLLTKYRQLPVINVCQIVRQAALGLAHAHAQGMVHRDIKPQNVMFTRKGQVKLLDFGLARLGIATDKDTDSPSPPTGPTNGVTLNNGLQTEAGVFLGTPDYVAPEQALNATRADARSDIYSLGCTCYFLLTGRPPFPDGTVFEKLACHAARTPPVLSQFRDDIPPELERIVSRMLAKSPTDRFSSADDVARALAPFAKSSPIPPRKDGNPLVSSKPIPSNQSGNTRVAPPVTRADGLGDIEVLDQLPVETGHKPAVKTNKRANKNAKQSRKPLWVGIGGLSLLIVLLLTANSYLGTHSPIGRMARSQSGSNGAKSLSESPGVTGRSERSGTSRSERTINSAETAGPDRRVLFVIPNQKVWYADYGPVKDRLMANGYEVITASIEKGMCIPEHDPRYPDFPHIEAEAALGPALRAADFAAILFAGFRIDPFLEDGPGFAETSRLLREFRTEKKLIGGICVGQIVLARHHVLDELPAAGGSFVHQTYPYRVAGGPKWAERPVVVNSSARIVTARDDKAAIDFADAVLTELKSVSASL